MAEKMLHSVYGNDSLELAWENGQILVQGVGSSSRTRKSTPSGVGHSINPSSRREEANDEDACISKRTSLNTLYSLLDFRAHTDSDLDSSNRNSHQSNDQGSCQLDLQFSKSKSCSKLQDGCASANLRPVKESNLTAGARQPATPGNGYPCTFSPQQWLPSVPPKKTRMDSSQTFATNSQKQHIGCDQSTGEPAGFVKFTYKGKSATWKTNNTVLARVEDIKAAGKVEKTTVAATSSKAPDHSVVIDSAKGSQSHGVEGFQEQTALIACESNPASYVAGSTREPLPDEYSEAVGNNSALSVHEYQGQYHNQTSSSAGLKVRAKGKADDTNFCNEQLLACSSVCSLGASNDANLCSRKHEDTDDSTYLSDNDEEPEDVDVVKETPAREGTRVKRSRNTEIHNLYERKRRDKINKKMRVLKELIPNCNKIDKASMLDDAIEYLKTLKLQLQIMSMGTGFCMPLMMLPAAAHHINTPHLPQLMGSGLGFRPGTGIPCSLPQFPIPPLPGITDNRLQMFGFPNQVPPMPIPHSPFIPMIGNPSTQPLLATSTTTNLAEHLTSGQLTNLELSVPKNSDLNGQAECATKQAPNQGAI